MFLFIIKGVEFWYKIITKTKLKESKLDVKEAYEFVVKHEYELQHNIL